MIPVILPSQPVASTRRTRLSAHAHGYGAQNMRGIEKDFSSELTALSNKALTAPNLTSPELFAVHSFC